MFKSRSNAPHSSHDAGLIGQGLTIDGNIDSDSAIILQGQIIGNIRCKQLSVAQSGKVTGNICAETVIVDGTVTGDIDAGHLKLQAHANVNGQLRYNVIEIDAGAKIEGQFSPKQGADSATEISAFATGDDAER